MKKEEPASVKAFADAIQKMKDKYGYSLRQMCIEANVSPHAAGRAYRGDIKQRISAQVLKGLKSKYPEFRAAYDAAIG